MLLKIKKYYVILICILSVNQFFAQSYFVNYNTDVILSDTTLKSDTFTCTILNIIKKTEEDTLLLVIKAFTTSKKNENDSNKHKYKGLNNLFEDINKEVINNQQLNITFLNYENIHLLRNYFFDSTILIQKKNAPLIKLTGAIQFEYYLIKPIVQQTFLQANQTIINMFAKPLEINFSNPSLKNKKYETFYRLNSALKAGKIFLNSKSGDNYFFMRHSYNCRECDIAQAPYFFIYQTGKGIIGFKTYVPIYDSRAIDKFLFSNNIVSFNY